MLVPPLLLPLVPLLLPLVPLELEVPDEPELEPPELLAESVTPSHACDMCSPSIVALQTPSLPELAICEHIDWSDEGSVLQHEERPEHPLPLPPLDDDDELLQATAVATNPNTKTAPNLFIRSSPWLPMFSTSAPAAHALGGRGYTAAQTTE